MTTETQTLNLSVCGEKHQADLPAVGRVITPASTDTWQPISHTHLIDRMRDGVKAHNLDIVQEYHCLHRGGQRYFGLFQVNGIDRAGSDVATVLGLRNSHDKAFAAGIMAGDAPFVCTNLIFSNEIVLGRKHTSNIITDLPRMIGDALTRLDKHWGVQDRRIAAYKEKALTDSEAHDLILRAHREGACGSTQISKIAEQWHNPEHDEFSNRNGWSLFNAFTNVFRGNVNALAERSFALHGVLDKAFGVN